jgi:thiol-disulfide isomerase/thioredoxin
MLLVPAASFAAALEPPKNFVMHATPKPAVAAFEDAQGHSRSLADFKGKVVVLNIWATWCVPCRREMPALDRLQAKLGSPDFEVVPVSIDRGGIETVRKFYGEIGVQNVGIYIDRSGQVLRTLTAVGLPTTVLVDRTGREIGRIVGPAEWDSPEIVEFLTRIASAPDDAAERNNQNSDAATQQRDGSSRLLVALQWLKALFLK